jgi:hypothetical protein
MMNSWVADRNTHVRSARSALIAGLVAWLSFVMQPCVMAAPLAGTAGNDDVELSAETHHGSGIPADACLHCIDVGSTPASASGACDDVSLVSVSPKTNPLDKADNSWTPAIPASLLPDVRQIVPRSVRVSAGAERLPRTVSLTVTYCVFLE